MPTWNGYVFDRLSVGSWVPASRKWEGRKLTVERGKAGSRLVTAGVLPDPVIDVSWLKAASDVYQISANPKDFVFIEVPANQADLPNRNLDSFPLSSLTQYRPILGKIAYKSYAGKSFNVNHDNKDPAKAKGVIFDAHMVKEGNYWFVNVVAGVCRQKDPQLANRILNRQSAGYSMACLIGSAVCSICGFESQGSVTCRHINGGLGKGTVIHGQLVFEHMKDLNFWELSHVEDPADVDALDKWVKAASL